jgi:hypothetical protein
MVYGNIVKPLKRSLTIPQTALAVCVVASLMVALAAARLAWKARAARKVAPPALSPEPALAAVGESR